MSRGGNYGGGYGGNFGGGVQAVPPPAGGSRFGAPVKPKVVREGLAGIPYVDWKDIENLRRCMSPNGKIYGRKRLGTTAREQRMLAQAVKRARFMGLLPYTSATL